MKVPTRVDHQIAAFAQAEVGQLRHRPTMRKLGERVKALMPRSISPASRAENLRPLYTKKQT